MIPNSTNKSTNQRTIDKIIIKEAAGSATGAAAGAGDSGRSMDVEDGGDGDGGGAAASAAAAGAGGPDAENSGRGGGSRERAESSSSRGGGRRLVKRGFRCFCVGGVGVGVDVCFGGCERVVWVGYVCMYVCTLGLMLNYPQQQFVLAAPGLKAESGAC